MKRAAWVERVRLVHLVITMSSLHFPSGQGMHAFEGDAAAGRSFSFDGSGNHHVVGWSPEGVVAFGFDHDFSRTKNAELLDELPADVRPLAEELIVWKAPVNDVAWWSVAEDRRGGASNTHRLDDLKNPDVEKACAALQEHHGISDAMLDLARTLARETGGARRALTEAEANVVLAHPEDEGRAPTRASIAAAVRHFAAVGVDWTNIESTDEKRARTGEAKRAAEATADRGDEVIAAVCRRDHAAVRALVAAGANLERQAKPGDAPPPPTPPPCMTFKPPEAGGPTPLWIAATQKDLEMARLLLDGGASVDASCEPYPPLDAALLAGSGAIVDLLLERAKRRVNPLRLKVLTLHFASAEMFEICLDRGWMDQLAPAVVQDLEVKFAAQGRPDVIARYKARFG